MKNENDQWNRPPDHSTDYCGNMIYENGVLKHCEKIT